MAGVVSVCVSGCIIESTQADLYESCRDSGDCDRAADDCFAIQWDDGDGSMCSRDCANDSDCPGWAACYALEGDPSVRRICYARCDTNFDCPSGFRCASATIAGIIVDAICMPR